MEIKRNKTIKAQFDKIDVMEKELKAFRKQKRAEILAIEQEVANKELEFIKECNILDTMIKEHHDKIANRNRKIKEGMARWKARKNAGTN